MGSKEPRKIDLTQLQPQQVLEIRKSTEQEINHFTQSLQALQSAQAKLKDCINSIDKLEQTKTSSLLVPLTSSLYVPGNICKRDEYLVDIGTGYYVTKLAKEAKTVYNKKVEKLNEDSKKLKDILVQKNDIMNAINLVLRNKMIEYESQQKKD